MFLIFFFFSAYGKFGSHGLFAIYWISRNNGPRCIGATLYKQILYYELRQCISKSSKRLEMTYFVERINIQFRKRYLSIYIDHF